MLYDTNCVKFCKYMAQGVREVLENEPQRRRERTEMLRDLVEGDLEFLH